MNRPARNHPASWSRSVLPSTRRWIAVPLVLAVLGGLAGVAAGLSSQASAEALLLVRGSSVDSTGVDRAAANAALELDTRETYAVAAERLNIDAIDLRRRTEVTTVPLSQIIAITVTAPTPEQAVSEADALAEAGVAAGPSRIPAALDQLTEATRDLLTADNLENRSAETARVSRLGDELGASQASLVAESNQLQLLQSGEPNNRLPSAPVLGLMSALAAGLVGVLVALLLGARRGAVKSGRELSDLYPDAVVVDSSDLGQALKLEPGARTVILAGTRGAKLSGATETVRSSLDSATGKKVVLTDDLGAIPMNGSPNGHINLVTTTLSESVLRRARRDEGSVLIVAVQPRVTKLESVEEFAPRLPDRSYLLVDNGSPQWD